MYTEVFFVKQTHHVPSSCSLSDITQMKSKLQNEMELRTSCTHTQREQTSVKKKKNSPSHHLAPKEAWSAS